MDRGAERAGDGRGGDFAFDAFEHDAVAARADDLAIADRDAAAGRELDQAGIAGRRLPLPSKMMPESRMWSAPRATISGALSVATMRVAPGTPISRAPVGSTRPRAR